MKKFELMLNAIQVPLDAVVLFAAGITAYALRFTHLATGIRPVLFTMTSHDFVRVLITVVPVWILVLATNGLYTMDSNRKFANEISRIFFACTVGLAAITVYIFFRGEFFNSRFIVLAAWIVGMVYVTAVHLFMRLIKLYCYTRGVGARRIVILGSGPITDRLAEIMNHQKSLGYTIVARYPIFNEKVREEILALDGANEVDEILLSNPKASREETLTILAFAEENHFTLKYSADLFSTLAPNMRVSAIQEIPLIEFRRARLDGWGKVSKRLFDILGSLILIILTSPFLIGGAIAVASETGRPIFFKNTRVGFRGKLFRTLKFRSMYQKYCTEWGAATNPAALEVEEKLIVEQNSKEGPIYKIMADPRVTPVGAVIRRWSIDELPQLFNVLTGTMSLVGPRPHQPREVAKYSPEDRRVHAVKPGMTGLAQISGRSDLTFEDEIRLDMFYLENWSLVMDIFILVKTPFAVIRRRTVV